MIVTTEEDDNNQETGQKANSESFITGMHFLKVIMQVALNLFLVNLAVVSAVRTIVYEEESFAVHSGLVFGSTLQSMVKVHKVIDKMGRIEFEADMLQKKESHVTKAWEFYKNSAISKLKSKINLIEQRLSNTMNTTLNPWDAKNNSKSETGNIDSNSNSIRPNLAKRSIEFLGNIISYVTGVPSPSEWRLNQANIGHLKKALQLVDRKQIIQEHRITNIDHKFSDVSKKVENLLLSLNLALTEVSVIEHDFKATLIFGALENGVSQLLHEIEYLLNCVDNILFKGHFQLAS